MIREIPQKVETQAQLAMNSPLLRRTRTAVFFGCLFAVGSVSLLAPQQKAFAASSGNSRVSAASLKLADKVKRTIPRGALSTLESARRIRDELKNTKIRNVQKSALADSGAVVHKVRSGETLVEIAGRYGMPVETLVQTNDLDDPDDIQAKEAIVVPKAQSAAVSRVSALKGQTSQPFVIASIDDGAIASVAPQDFVSEQSERTSAQRELDLEKVHQSLEDLSQVQSNSAEDEVALTPTDIARTNLGKTSDPDIAAPSEKPGLDLIDIPVAVRGPLPSLPDLELPNLDSKDYLPSEWQGSGPVKFIWPAKGTFTSGFGWRWGRMHRGIDVAAPVGTPIVASAPGVVTYSQYNRGGYGNLVEITHPDGSLTLYAHNHRNLVKQGQFVSQGQQIAEMGNTGRSTGPHTHFELHKPGRGAINPVHLLGRG